MRKLLIVLSVAVVLSACARDYRYEHVPHLRDKLAAATAERNSDEAAWLEGIIEHLETKERLRQESIERDRREKEEKRRLAAEAHEAEERRRQEEEEAHRQWFASLTPDQQLQWRLQQQQLEFFEAELQREREQRLTIANQIKDWQEAQERSRARAAALRSIAEGFRNIHLTSPGEVFLQREGSAAYQLERIGDELGEMNRYRRHGY